VGLTIAATRDNRFVIAWEREVYKEDGWLEDVAYTVRGSNGALVREVTRLTEGVAGGDAYRDPTLTAVGDDRALIAYESPDVTSYTVIDSAGDPVIPTTGGWWGHDPHAVELSNGDIVLAWEGYVGFVVIDGDTYAVKHGVEYLHNAAAEGSEGNLSLAADQAGRAVLTWMDADWSYRPNLYYALVDGEGDVLTTPTIFRTSRAAVPEIETSYAGYGNASYTLGAPTTEGVDLWVTSSLAGGTPGGGAALRASLGNAGAAEAASVVLTATLDSRLAYRGASPAPAAANGDAVVWDLPDVAYLGGGQVVVRTDVPSATVGTRYPVTWTISSAGPEAAPADNTAIGHVMVARQVFLPLVLRGQ
jgi:hypothetical protein